MQVHRLAGNFTQSFMDYQWLSKAVTDSPEVFEQLQQAAHLCLGCHHHVRQVHHCQTSMLACRVLVCLLEFAAVAGKHGITSSSFCQHCIGSLLCLFSCGLAALSPSVPTALCFFLPLSV